MKKCYFVVNGWDKFSEQDIYSDGCQPDTATNYGGDSVFRSATLVGLIDDLLAFTGAEKEALLLDSCDEVGRIDISVLENCDGYSATPREIESWKAGEIKLWNSIYTFRAQYTESVPVDFENLLFERA